MFDSTCSRQKGLKRLTEHNWISFLQILSYVLLKSDSKTALMLHKTNLILNQFCLCNFLFLKNPENKLHRGFHKNIKHSFYKIENSASQYLQE